MINITAYVLLGYLTLISVCDIISGNKFSKIGPTPTLIIALSMYILGRLYVAS